MPRYEFAVDIPIDVDRFIKEGRMEHYASRMGKLLVELLMDDVHHQAGLDLMQMKMEVVNGESDERDLS